MTAHAAQPGPCSKCLHVAVPWAVLQLLFIQLLKQQAASFSRTCFTNVGKLCKLQGLDKWEGAFSIPTAGLQ